MLLLCIAFVLKSDFLRNCCISCLLNTSWLLQSRVLKNPSQILRKSFLTSTILKVSQECAGVGGRDMQPSFCRRRHFGGSWYWVGSGNPVMRGLDFILFFFSYFVFSPAKQLVGSSCHFLEVPSEGWEMNLSFCHCKQRTGDSLSSKGLGTLLVGQRKRPQSRVGRRRVPTCPRAHTGAKGQSACL